MESIKNWLLDILFPETCLGCGMKGESICDRCLARIPRAERDTPPSIMGAYDYRDHLIKDAIWNLKYHKRRYVGEKLGRALYEAFIEDIADMKLYAGSRPILVIPVPASPSRRRKRGYNQAAVIGRHFCRSGGIGILELKQNILAKKKDVPPQARIANRQARLKNIHGAFTVRDAGIIRGRTIIVVDDVTTTGGTLGEIIKILKKSGAAHVVGLALAH